MDIERCVPEGDIWRITVRYEGQPVNVTVSREDIDDLIEGENPDEVTVLDRLRDEKSQFAKAVKAAVMKSDFRPREFSSLTVVRE